MRDFNEMSGEYRKQWSRLRTGGKGGGRGEGGGRGGKGGGGGGGLTKWRRN